MVKRSYTHKSMHWHVFLPPSHKTHLHALVALTRLYKFTSPYVLPADTINAIMGAFGNGFTAFVFPAVYHMIVYRTAKARAACLKPPPRYLHPLLWQLLHWP
jgi:hypothetical protein